MLLGANTIPNDVLDAAKEISNRYSLPLLGVLSCWALESRWGQSALVKKTNNPFNIKGCEGYLVIGCEKAYDKIEKSNDSYRKYKNIAAGFHAYGDLITSGRYKGIEIYKDDPVGYFTFLKSKGYATDKNYVSKLTSIMKSIKIPETTSTNLTSKTTNKTAGKANAEIAKVAATTTAAALIFKLLFL